jgi:hypothetical protein
VPGEQTTKRRIDARLGAILAVVVLVSVAAGVLLQREKGAGGSEAGSEAPTTRTATRTATATPAPPADMRVSLAELCSVESIANSQDALGGTCPVAGVSVPVNGRRFAYQSKVGASTRSPGPWNDWIGFKNSDCTHLHLLFALDDRTSRPGYSARVRVVRPSGTAHSTTHRRQVGVLDADLDGHRRPFTLSSSATASADVFMRGYVVCPRPR